MEIKSARFIISNTQIEKCPQDGLPEYAFIGRSNVGKSSLINMLTRNNKLAMTSATPGKTLLINHFLINETWYLVDLPGYGYAQRGKQTTGKDYPYHRKLHSGTRTNDLFVRTHRQPARTSKNRPRIYGMVRGKWYPFCHCLHQGRQTLWRQIENKHGGLQEPTPGAMGRTPAHICDLVRETYRTGRTVGIYRRNKQDSIIT